MAFTACTLENNGLLNLGTADLQHIPNRAFTSLPRLKADSLEIPINDKDKVPFGKEAGIPQCGPSQFGIVQAPLIEANLHPWASSHLCYVPPSSP